MTEPVAPPEDERQALAAYLSTMSATSSEAAAAHVEQDLGWSPPSFGDASRALLDAVDRFMAGLILDYDPGKTESDMSALSDAADAMRKLSR